MDIFTNYSITSRGTDKLSDRSERDQPILEGQLKENYYKEKEEKLFRIILQLVTLKGKIRDRK